MTTNEPRADINVTVVLTMPETELLALIDTMEYAASELNADGWSKEAPELRALASRFRERLNQHIEDGYGRTWWYAPPICSVPRNSP